MAGLSVFRRRKTERISDSESSWAMKEEQMTKKLRRV